MTGSRHGRADSGWLWWLTAATLVVAVALGGATRLGSLGDVLVQYLSIPLLLAALWRAMSGGGAVEGAARIVAAAAGIAIVAAVSQLVPAWLAMAGGAAGPDLSAEGLRLLAEARRASPVVAPDTTIASTLSLLVPLAIFAATAMLPGNGRVALARVVVIVGTLSLFLGLLQVAQGPASPLRFYEITNRDDAVGTFANRNHFAALLYVTLSFATIWFIGSARLALARGGDRTVGLLGLTGGALLVVGIVAGIAVSRSRAGLLLTIVAMAAVMALIVMHRPREAGAGRERGLRKWTLAFLGVIVLAMAMAQFGLARLIQRFGDGTVGDMRAPLRDTTLETALAMLPFGTGLGSFVQVYAAVEKPEHLFQVFANRAHNDFIELFLEMGVVGAALIGGVIAFWAWHGIRAWARPQSNVSVDEIVLRRAAALAVALLVLHSLVDYPLRTTGLAAVFAFALAALLPVAEAAPAAPAATRRPGPGLPEPGPAAFPATPASPQDGADLLDEWRKRSEADR